MAEDEFVEAKKKEKGAPKGNRYSARLAAPLVFPKQSNKRMGF